MRTLPRPDEASRPFWTGGAEGELRILKCQDCQGYVHPPRPVCRHCLSENLAPEAMPGTGVVDTFTLNYQKWHPEMEVPYVVARVAVDGASGVYLTTNIVNCDPLSVDVDDKVRVTFEQQEDIYFPLFEPIENEGEA